MNMNSKRKAIFNSTHVNIFIFMRSSASSPGTKLPYTDVDHRHVLFAPFVEEGNVPAVT